MLSYLIGSAITLLTFNASATGIQAYVIWGMGDFSLVTLSQLPWYSLPSIILVAATLLLIKPLNILQMGNEYAESLGVSAKKTRNVLLLITCVLSAFTTAFCGPVTFIGLAVPHITRILFKTDNFRVLLPMTIVIGSSCTLLCNVLSTAPLSTPLPLAAITPFVGAPVVLWVLFRRK